MADALLERLAETEVTGTPAQPSRECAKAGIRLPASTIRLDPQRQAPDRPERACKPQSARAPAARTRGTAMRHIDLRFCEGIVSHFFGVIGSPQCKSLKTLEFEACRASIVSESCLETPKNRV